MWFDRNVAYEWAQKIAVSRAYNFVPVDQYIKNQESQWDHVEGIWKEIDHKFHLQFN